MATILVFITKYWGMALKNWRFFAAGLLLIALFAWFKTYVNGVAEEARRTGMNEQVLAEKACEEGTVCADTAVQRAKDQKIVILEAIQKATDRQAAEDKVRMDELEAARARLADTAAKDKIRVRNVEARYREALAVSQECEAWSETVVPCPLD